MLMVIANILQLIGGIVLSIGYLPQIKKSLKTKSVEDIDVAYYPFVFSGLSMFEFYAVTLVTTTGSGLMFLVTNSISMLCAGTMLTLSIVYRKKK